MPAADCSLPSGFSPPPPPRSELSEAASWIAWVAERLVTLSPKRIRDITSSCGRLGVEVKAICGFCALPEMLRMALRSEEHTSELQSLMRISYAVFCLKKKKNNNATIVPAHALI